MPEGILGYLAFKKQPWQLRKRRSIVSGWASGAPCGDVFKEMGVPLRRKVGADSPRGPQGLSLTTTPGKAPPSPLQPSSSTPSHTT